MLAAQCHLGTKNSPCARASRPEGWAAGALETSCLFDDHKRRKSFDQKHGRPYSRRRGKPTIQPTRLRFICNNN